MICWPKVSITDITTILHNKGAMHSDINGFVHWMNMDRMKNFELLCKLNIYCQTWWFMVKYIETSFSYPLSTSWKELQCTLNLNRCKCPSLYSTRYQRVKTEEEEKIYLFYSKATQLTSMLFFGCLHWDMFVVILHKWPKPIIF